MSRKNIIATVEQHSFTVNFDTVEYDDGSFQHRVQCPISDRWHTGYLVCDNRRVGDSRVMGKPWKSFLRYAIKRGARIITGGAEQVITKEIAKLIG